jgi:sugar lactone lactonase YvrE
MSARTGKTLGAALAALLLIAAAAPEGRLAQYQRLRAEAAAATRAPDLAGAETRLEAALALYPASPGTLLRLARVEGAAGKPDEALARLRTYADLGMAGDLAQDPALKPLTLLPGFAPVAARLAANAAPKGEPFEVIQPGKASDIWEGVVAIDDGWLISSVTARAIVQTTEDGSLSPFFEPDAETGSLFGMAVDRRGGALWVAEASGPGIPGSGGPRRTGLLKLSLSDGRVLARYPAPDDGKPHQLGDVTVAPDGTVYASDSVGAALYRLKPGGAALEAFVTSTEMASPQGMVVCPGGGALVVADYTTGLHRIDLKTGADTLVGGTDGVALAGTDGLSPLPRKGGGVWLLATQNGVAPQRVLALRLSRDCRTQQGAEVLASGGTDLDDLSLGAAGGSGGVVIGSSGWAGYDGEGRPLTPTPRAARLLFIPLP